MFVKLVCLFFVVLSADGASLSGKCPRVKNSVEPDLDKLSGLWHVIAFYPEGGRTLRMEFKRDGANYTITSTLNETLTRSIQVAVGVDEENRKVMKLGNNNEPPYPDDGYLLAAEYDKFSIIYNCERVHDVAIVLSRSKDVDEDTRKKIKNVLLEYPQLEELKDKFD